MSAAAGGLSGGQLVPLSPGQPRHHQVVGVIDELQHVLIGTEPSSVTVFQCRLFR